MREVCNQDFALEGTKLNQIQIFYCTRCITPSVYEFAKPISMSLCQGNTATFEEMLQRRRAVGNTVSDLTGLKFEP